MTTLDERAPQADTYTDLLKIAADLAITTQYCTPDMLRRKLRVGEAELADLLADLEELGVIDQPGRDSDSRAVLLPADRLDGVLDTIAKRGQEPPAEVVLDVLDDDQEEAGEPELVSLVKPDARVAIRPDDEVAVPPKRAPAVPGKRQLDTRRQRMVGTVRAVVASDHPAVVATRHRTRQGWHVTRSMPKVGVLLVVYSPRGLLRAMSAYARYLRDAETAELRALAHEIGDHDRYAKSTKDRSTNLRARLIPNLALIVLATTAVLGWTAPHAFGVALGILMFAGVVALLGRTFDTVLIAAGLAVATYFCGLLLSGLLPQPSEQFWWIASTIGVLVFGWLGRPREQRLVEMPAFMAPHVVPALTAPMVTAALCTLGLSKMKEPEDIRLLMDVARHGQGYQVDLELPPGVPTNDIIEKREEFAAALRRELGTVWPAVGPRHPGHLSLFVSDVAMATARQSQWPLENGGKVSLFDPLPLFTDQRGQWVYQTLAYTSWVIGAVPRMGKTRSLLNLGLTCALDPRARLYVFDLKGTGDLSALAKVAHFYGVGDEPEDIELMLQVLRSLREEMRKRARLVRDLTLEENPDKGKVTDALASRDPKRFGPIVVQADEVQVWTQEFSEALPGQVFEGKRPKDPGKEVRDEFIAILRDLVKRGPALGIITMLATQKPDAKSIPSSIADNASARLCFKVNGQISNDQILGTSSYQAGVRATQFAFSDKGIAYFRGDGAEPLVVRTVDMDATRAEEVAARARALRLSQGLLTGDADEIEDAVLVTDIVDDVEMVMRSRSRGTAHHQELVEWLGDLRQEDYEAITVDELSARLRARSVKISQLRIGGVNRKGVRISDLRKHDDGDDG